MFKFNILKKYFLIEYSKIILNITLIFLALGVILNLLEEMSFFKNHDIGVMLPLTLTFLKVPSMIYKIFPFIFLISSIILFLKTIQSEEINAIKVAGISNFKIIVYPALISLFFGLVIVLGINIITSKLTYKYLDIKNNYTQENDYLAALTENGIWIKDQIEGKTNIIRATGLTDSFLKDVSIYKFDENNEHQTRIESKKANISNNIWKLVDAKIYYKDSNNIYSEHEKYSFESNFDILSVKNLFSNLDAVSFWELNKLKENYEYLGYSTRKLESEFQRALSYPLFLMAMTLLAGVIVMNIKYRGSYLGYVFITIILSVIIFYLNDFSKALGDTEKISLIMSVWTPVSLVFIVSAIGMTHVNEK